MSAYDDSFRLEMLDLVDDLTTDFQEAGLIFAEVAVSLVKETRTGADPDAGKPGTVTAVSTPITPRPRADLRKQWRTVNGERVRVGDGLLEITRAVTREQLLGCDYVDIGGEKYRFDAGYLKKGTLRWRAVVKKYR